VFELFGFRYICLHFLPGFWGKNYFLLKEDRRISDTVILKTIMIRVLEVNPIPLAKQWLYVKIVI